MNSDILILIAEAVTVYLLVLLAHSLRFRAGLGPFYALLGGITAIMSWVTDAGLQVEAAGITFMVGSTVFYTALLLGVFVVYVFDGPRATRVAILTVAGVSALVPIIAAVLNYQLPDPLPTVPTPSLRINSASVLTTIADLIFLAMAWEFLGRPRLQLKNWLRALLTLLGVMVLDVALFNTGAFAGTPAYVSIMGGTLISRLMVAAFAFPFLYGYLTWQNSKPGVAIENRPVLSILHEVAEAHAKLNGAQEEIERRKRAEEALRRERATLEEAERLTNTGAWEWDFETDHFSFSENWCRIHGVEQRSLPGKELMQIAHPEDRGAIAEAWQRTVQFGEAYAIEHRIVRRTDGEVRIVRAHGRVQLDEEGNPVRAYGSAQDVTEQRKAQEALHREQALLEEAERLTGTGGGEWDLATDQFTLTENWHRIHGVDKGVMTSEELMAIIHPEDREAVAEVWKRTSQFGEPYTMERRIIRPDNGEVRLVRTHGRVEFDEDAKPRRVYGAAQDITEQREAEREREALQEELRQAQKMEAVGTLAGGIAHDFNNKLGVILGHVQMALRRTEPEDRLHKQLVAIREAAEYSAKLTEQLLGFARRQIVQPEVLDLNEAVRGRLDMMGHLIGEQITLGWEPAPELWPVRLDPGQLDQILTNTAVNAREAVEGVGTITLATENVTLACDHCAGQPDCTPGDHVLLSISDDGCGMDEETLSHIFEPFFTTREVGEGSGLGLSTVYGIVRQNGGFVTADSAPGEGTTIHIYLPRHEPEGEEQPMEQSEAQVPGGTETVLVVEDELPLLDMVEDMLSGLGYTVLATQSPREAVRLAAEHDGIHLLITDVFMPEMNGGQLATRLRADRPELKVLFISGYAESVIRERGVVDSDIPLLQKPFSVEELSAEVRRVVEG